MRNDQIIPPFSVRPVQRGFALVTAIFLVVVLAALGTFMVSISTTHQAEGMLDLQGARAYQAARAGVEWGAWQAMDPENRNYGLTSGFIAQYACPASTILPAMGGTLSGFTVTVTCTSANHSDGGVLKRVYTLTSTASTGIPASVDFVERQVAVTLSTCRQAPGGASC